MINEVPRLQPARRGLSLFYHGKTLLSTIDPVGQSEKAAKTYSLKTRTLYLIVSPLFGYGISQLLEHMPEDSALIGLEVDPNLFLTTKDEFVRNIPEQVPYIATDSAEELCRFVRRKWGPRRFRRIELITLNAGWTLNEELYIRLFHALQSEISTDWANAMTLTRMGRLYAKNTLRNLSTLARHPSIDTLHFGTAPVLLAGAGPSLDMVLGQLVENFPGIYDKTNRPFRIICVDTALRAFLSRSIPVDLVVALEAQIWNLKDFIGYGETDFDLAADLSAHPDTIQIGPGKIFFFFTPWTKLSFIDRLEQAGILPVLCPPLGSVGLTAVHLALSLTEGPIFIAGLDFSYTTELYHTKSSPGYQRRYCRQNRLTPITTDQSLCKADQLKIIDKNGGKVLSDRALRRYWQLFIREFGNNLRLVDISPSGLDLTIRHSNSSDLLNQAARLTPRLLEQKNPERCTHDTPQSHTDSMAIEGDRSAVIKALLTKELAALTRLRALLSGEASAAAGELDKLLDYCDYLWAHFPECAAAEGQRPGTNSLSFLKRVRAELDYFIKIVELGLKN